MKWTRFREKSAAIIAIAFVIIFGLFALAAYGIHIPIFSDLVGALLGR